ncbi:hypothetical protein [Polyangium aurulentum]|uniref:hypothetical protein n=1 Tax=Polyangium aurulentum TaxID=2567896 RepID=UPI0010AE1290|nr:hypothetical protein [Polyangium aurulentum]UQA55407.1 hypothetical protein E8A73_029155 [Polyangium aurulentum]
MRRLLPLFVLVAMAGCGPSAASSNTPDPNVPSAQSTPPDGASTETAPPESGGKTDKSADTGKGGGKPGAFREENLDKMPAFELAVAPLPAAPKGLPEPPKTCAAFVQRKPAAAPACADAAAALDALDKALAEAKPDKRDAALAGLESCAGLPAGVARALRAELAPAGCGDVLVEPLVNAPPKGTDGAVYGTLRGLALAARLARTGSAPPKLSPPYDKKRVQEFVAGPMSAWMNEQAAAIQELSNEGAKLTFYGRGLVALEAGSSDLRVVEAVRSVPLPAEIAKDQELKNIYYAQLDQALDPRKDRGRDAALVGLRDFAQVGVLRDARLDTARGQLSRLYGGRRIDALDGLVLPALAKAAPADMGERLAGKLPTFYAGLLLGREAAAKPSVMRMLLDRGVPMQHRIALKSAELSPDTRRLYARARLELGRIYLRALDFDQAAALLSALPAADRTPEDAFLLALATALRNGPEDAAVMVRNAPVPMLGMGQVGDLDAIARAPQKGPLAGAAAFDAALIKQITAPAGANAAYFLDVAARYREASKLLTDPAQRTLADDRARAAEATAKAIP